MAHNVAQKLIAAHLVEGEMKIGEEIGLKIDQTLCQDATGTMVMLECEAMNLPKQKPKSLFNTSTIIYYKLILKMLMIIFFCVQPAKNSACGLANPATA